MLKVVLISYARTAITGTRKAHHFTLRMVCICYLEHSCIVIEIRDVLEQVSPDADVIQHHTHAAAGQRMTHVIRVA